MHPIYNGGALWRECVDKLVQLKLEFLTIVIDSSSTDGSYEYTIKNDIKCIQIDKKEFNHGGTRNIFLELLDGEEYLVFLTQDALIESRKSIELMLDFFDDDLVGAVCGRQKPHTNANPLASHARKFNYPSTSSVKSINQKNKYGVKTAFLSNSFAAYRVSALEKVGCFPEDTILCEDMYVAAKMLIAGLKIAYSSESIAFHSHNYTFIEEFMRYFDIGVFHKNQPWVQKELGKIRGEGLKFMVSELTYLIKAKQYSYIPRSILMSISKFLGYKMGLLYNIFPKRLVLSLSMHKAYWQKLFK